MARRYRTTLTPTCKSFGPYRPIFMEHNCTKQLLNVFINNITATFIYMLPCIVIDFFLNNQPDALIIQIYSVIKLYLFRSSSLPIIRSFTLYIRHCYVSCRFFNEFHPDSAWKWSSHICMKLTSAYCTEENSWWWAERMPETCRVLWQNKFG
jgi:hypothetical protein